MKAFAAISVIFIFFLLWPKAAKAVSFTLVYDEEGFEVSANGLEALKGPGIYRLNRIVENRAVNLDGLLLPAFGKTVNAVAQKPKSFSHRPDKIYKLISSYSEKINSQPDEPKLTIENNRAVEFVPPKNGKVLDVYQSALEALNNLENSRATSSLMVYELKPRYTLAEINNLGINELIAEGISNFSGSPQNRRHNIRVGAEKMKGVILAPGEEFSFNKFLGSVEKEEGFLPELVIKREGTVPELGGGLCQVSSTAFRAAVNAGLPITERRNHSYAVQYYSPQGTDATIYPGVIDLKFINDTAAHLLIWPYIKDTNYLAFGLYGTKDSRVITLNDPVQYDRKSDGSMKAYWTREVFNHGTTTVDTFKSVYLPPALFHKQEEFVPATTTAVSQAPPVN